MTDHEQQTRALFVELSSRQGREQAAKALAEHLGAVELFGFLADSELDGLLVPAPGFKATLPGGATWDAILERAGSPGVHRGKVSLSAGAQPEAAVAYRYGEVALVFAGAHIERSRLEPIIEMTPMLEAVLRAEHADFITQGRLAVARQAARQSAALAEALERTRGAREQAVTDLEQQARKLAKARAAAEEALRVKDEFLAMLGHELRNPLAPICTALEIMRLKGAESSELDILERQVQHLTRLVDDLLDISRITQGKIELRPERIELAEVVNRSIEMVSPLLAQKRQELSVDVASSGLVVEVDPTRFAQVISNLLSNAAKFSPEAASIEIDAERTGETVALTVRDEGVGIAADDLAQIFDQFVQRKQGVDRAQGGLGLGLAIVKSIVEMHDGTVSAHSEGGGCGSEFSVEIPLAADSSPAAREASSTDEEQAGQHETRILIVDDNADAAELLAEMLRTYGYVTQIAPDGPSALELVAEFEPNIGLIDIGLPVMNGYELAGRLREWAGSRPLKLIAVTGYGQESDRQKSRDAGFDAHCVKPVDLNALQQRIEELRAN